MNRPHPGPLPQERERDNGDKLRHVLCRVRYQYDSERGERLEQFENILRAPLLRERAGVRADFPFGTHGHCRDYFA